MTARCAARSLQRHVEGALRKRLRYHRATPPPGTRPIERPGGSWLFLNCGVYNALFEALSCQGSTRYPVKRIGRSASAEEIAFTICGPTGDGLDVIDRDVLLPADMAEGDRLRFSNAGAYTLALASTFNGFPKPEVRVVRGA